MYVSLQCAVKSEPLVSFSVESNELTVVMKQTFLFQPELVTVGHKLRLFKFL